MCGCLCVIVCACVCLLTNPLPVAHDMFISLLPVCIVNAKCQPELQYVYVLLYTSVYLHVQALNKHKSREKTPLAFKRSRHQIHRDKAEISV